jgi:hypothetical protein
MSSGSSSGSEPSSDSSSDSTRRESPFDDYVQIFESFERVEKSLVDKGGRDPPASVEYHYCINKYSNEINYSGEFQQMSSNGRIRLRTALSHQCVVVAMVLFENMYDGSARSILDQLIGVWRNSHDDLDYRIAEIDKLRRDVADYDDHCDQVLAIVQRTLAALKNIRGAIALRENNTGVYNSKRFKRVVPKAAAKRYYPKDQCYTLKDLKKWAKMLAKK